ncbi:MAG: HlyD family efflux transporter periplasmic adaptor subunit [Pseudomonadales bacterium]
MQSLSKQQFVSQDQLDSSRTRAASCGSAVAAAQAGVEAARSAGKVAQAGRDRLLGDLADSSIRAPFSGYILYRLAEAGEMIAAGSPLVTLVSDNEVYLTAFLPAEVAGKLALGDEARLQMDAKPDEWVPATVTFVAAEAEFTPKSVETASERSNLVFRTRIGVDPAVLAQNPWLKSGMPGLGWLRVDSDATWPSAPSR